VPVLVVHGRRDRNAPYGGGRDWAEIWPGARLVSLENAAHALWIDDPAVLDDLETFLKGGWPARAERLSPGAE
jgi:pimeloyl-ACP methyl ester carboxylesterase